MNTPQNETRSESYRAIIIPSESKRDTFYVFTTINYILGKQFERDLMGRQILVAGMPYTFRKRVNLTENSSQNSGIQKIVGDCNAQGKVMPANEGLKAAKDQGSQAFLDCVAKSCNYDPSKQKLQLYVVETLSVRPKKGHAQSGF